MKIHKAIIFIIINIIFHFLLFFYKKTLSLFISIGASLIIFPTFSKNQPCFNFFFKVVIAKPI